MKGYIYCIENKINQKKYVGKTIRTIEERFNEHKRELKLTRSKDKLLYKAIKKHGIENFEIKELEATEYINLSEKEIFWISELNTCVYNDNSWGYNLTIGGEGSHIYEFSEDELFDYLKKHYTYLDIARIYGCSKDTIQTWMRHYDINGIYKNQTQRKEVLLIEKNIEFNSIGDAAQWVINNKISSADKEGIRINIGRCCNGKRKESYGSTWKYI